MEHNRVEDRENMRVTDEQQKWASFVNKHLIGLKARLRYSRFGRNTSSLPDPIYVEVLSKVLVTRKY